jgi:hypothetical protein
MWSMNEGLIFHMPAKRWRPFNSSFIVLYNIGSAVLS